MKLRKLLSNQVNYFGIELTVPNDVRYIATDSDGCVYGYYVEPNLGGRCWNVYDDAVSLATVDLVGTDWRATLRVVGE